MFKLKEKEEFLKILDEYKKRPLLVGVTGRVSIGKSTFSENLKKCLEEEGISVNILSTDNFLFSNKEIVKRKIEEPRGFPKTYDSKLLRDALINIKDGKDFMHPIYSHEEYDILKDYVEFKVCEINIVEGVNLFYDNRENTSLREIYDLVFFLNTDTENTWKWYLKRVHEYIDLNEDKDNFFYQYKNMTDEEVERESFKVWDSINVLNDKKYIDPTKDISDYVVNFDSKHNITSIELV